MKKSLLVFKIRPLLPSENLFSFVLPLLLFCFFAAIHAALLLTLSPSFSRTKNLDRALVGRLDVVRLGAVHEHAGDLHLAVGVEGDQADVGLGEGLGGRLDLLEDLRRVGAAEHGQLVHRPVAVVLVAARVADADRVGVGDVGLARVGELERRDPAVAGDVVDLLGDLRVRERGQVGEGLEEPLGVVEKRRVVVVVERRRRRLEDKEKKRGNEVEVEV